MPRVPVAPSKAPAPAPVGRGKNAKGAAPLAATRTFADAPPPRQPNEKEVCPLCVEDLDDTDLAFQPCPCGYRVCLFCFGKLKLHCNSACPNCRRVYGSEEAMLYAKQLEAEKAQEALKPKPPPPTSATGTAAASKALPKPAAAQPLRREAFHAAPSKRNSGVFGEEGPTSSGVTLPSGATWGATAAPAASPMALSRDQSVEIERPALPMDEASWPSLASAAPPPQPAPPQQHHHHNNHHRHKSVEVNGDNTTTTTTTTCHTSSVASSCMDRAASSASLDLMSQDPPVTPEQLAQLQHQHAQYQAQHASVAAASLTSAPPFPSLPPGFEGSYGSYFGAQVTTTVNGVRRAVHVPLPLGAANVEPYPEAPAMLSSMQQGLAAGTLNCKDAAAQLMGLLHQKDQEGQVARARALVAVGKVPPGFGPAPATAAPAGATATGAAQNGGAEAAAAPSMLPAAPAAAPSVRAPPPGFGHLGGANNDPSLGAGRLRTTAHGLGAIGDGGLASQYGGMTGNPRTYSMWSGLPGIDLGPSSSLSSIWSNAPAVQQPSSPYTPLGAGMDSPLAFQGVVQQAGAVAPPPGFGPSPYQAAQQQQSALSANDLFRQPYNPLAARYNPLAHASYRPPLGAGL